MKKHAFTLAEVLITLGIIGVVAALTMPSLIGNYQKNVVTTRMKKFYSMINQAALMRTAHEQELNKSMLTAADNPNIMLDFFNTNYAPYITTVKTKTKNKGLAVAFTDGSGVYMWKDYAGGAAYQSTASTYTLFCPVYRDCENIEETKEIGYLLDGKKIFLFWTDGGLPVPGAWDGTRDGLKAECGGKGKNNYACAKLIADDGWQIKDDYPW
ncbi:MAG: type II secretion system GspH family protein [Heliobacteriaceae bacterium]|jgi:prepilin-type N-terminal cleavage/methylation domain-containing protein|nr:type II secretion system GspH family protein [Heliobacteriaceae bacterium]